MGTCKAAVCEQQCPDTDICYRTDPSTNETSCVYLDECGGCKFGYVCRDGLCENNEFDNNDDDDEGFFDQLGSWFVGILSCCFCLCVCWVLTEAGKNTARDRGVI